MPPVVSAILRGRARDTPGQVALLLDDGASLTFADWHTRAERLAAGLAGRGVRRGDRVVLSCGPDGWLDYAVAFAGVLRAGGVAVPVSTSRPADEVRAVLADCAPAGTLWSGRPPEVAAGWSVAVDAGEADAPADGPERPDPEPSDLAQILYTSGTTGTRKGVAASHANLAGGLPPARPRPLSHSRHALHAFPLGTNAAQTMLLTGLVARPTTVVLRRFDADVFGALIARLRIGSVFVVPAMAADLVRSGALGRHDLSGVVLLGSTAAPLPAPVAAALAAALPTATLIDTYTTTESAPAQTVMVHDPRRPDAVGRPLHPGGLRITDASGRPVPAGTTGPVWLRSTAPARHYWRDEAATGRVFDDGWVRTGDLGRVDADGFLHLVDRESDLVDVGGHNVATLQVERAMREHPDVHDAAVFGVPRAGGTLLAAAVVASASLPAPALRRFLAGRLAAHEVPAWVDQVAELPRNEAGKVRKRDLAARAAARLPGADAAVGPGVADGAAGGHGRDGAHGHGGGAGHGENGHGGVAGYVGENGHRGADGHEGGATEAARFGGSTAQALAELWREVLGTPPADADADFFAAGGDSLTATRLAAAASSRFGVDVPTGFALDLPVLRDQAARLAALRDPGVRPAVESTADGDDARPPDPRAGLLPWPMQEHFWDWARRTGHRRLVPPVVRPIRIREAVQPAVLRRALDALVARHDALRTVLLAGPDGPRQVVLPTAQLPLRVVDPPAGVDAERWAERAAVREWRTPFDPSRAPKGRALLVRLGPADAVLVLVLDHLAADGESGAVLLRELGLLYSAFRAAEPSPLPTAGPSAAALVEAEHAEHARTLPHWRDRLAGVPAHPGAPADLAEVGGYRYAEWAVEIPAETTARLAEAAAAAGTTPFVLLLAAWTAMLPRVAGTTDLVVSTPLSGRVDDARQDVVGCLARNALLRVDVGTRAAANDGDGKGDGDGDGPTFAELVRRVRAATVAAIDHQVHPFETCLRMVPHVSRVNVEEWPLHLPGLVSERFELGEVPSPDQVPADRVDVRVPDLVVRTGPGGWRVIVLGNAYAVPDAVAEDLVDGFVATLRDGLDDPDRPVPSRAGAGAWR